MIFGVLLDWTTQAKEFYETASVYRKTPKIKNLLIRKQTQKDGALVVFGYESPLGNTPLLVAFLSAGLGLFFWDLFSYHTLALIFWGASFFFVLAWYVTTPAVIFHFFRLGLKKAQYSGKLQRLSTEEIIRRLLKK